ncbi:uncharacterized protein [Physcomitrium patens]|uniref:Uncharacterized protein n=1 Tax=Physcomitrium patens TaxID=3218 RepID=A0A2K1K614_PHYPA|nr:uncharacterized protein LOC112285518 [Physcomitrium patens]PNR49197.1 hypothetical protein PHYPA_011093 [Physcomitrium patens]|eukprot:XP_024382195.1 uncharacterized protein LOC112285518 [Physcomitrella patens]
MARAQMRWISCQFTIALCIVTVTLPQVVPASGAARDVTVDAVRFLGFQRKHYLRSEMIPAREGWHVTVWQDSPLQDPELSLDESSSEANLVEGRELFEFAADYEKPCANKKHDPSVCKNG